VRCPWCGADPLYVAYHDREWGVPVHDDRTLFEFLVLESAQAGLSWRMVLGKRDGYRKAFAGFDPAAVARYGTDDEERLLADAGIVRNRAKIRAAIGNARAFLDVQGACGSFAQYQWGFVDGTPVVNRWEALKDLPPRTDLSDRWAKDLKQRGFKFLGSTVVYAHMQATGMINDHLVSCFRHAELAHAQASPTLRRA
jgi:DNA-3-methyladenine glycosylase I